MQKRDFNDGRLRNAMAVFHIADPLLYFSIDGDVKPRERCICSYSYRKFVWDRLIHRTNTLAQEHPSTLALDNSCANAISALGWKVIGPVDVAQRWKSPK